MASQMLNLQPWIFFVVVIRLNCRDINNGNFGNLNQNFGIIIKLVIKNNKKSNGNINKINIIGRKKKY